MRSLYENRDDVNKSFIDPKKDLYASGISLRRELVFSGFAIAVTLTDSRRPLIGSGRALSHQGSAKLSRDRATSLGCGVSSGRRIVAYLP